MTMDKQLRRILNLVRKTGDRMVVTDANGEDVYVVLGLEQYEALVGAEDGGGDDDFGEGWWRDGDEPFVPPNIDDILAGADMEGEKPREAPAAEARHPADIWEAMKPASESGETWDINRLTGEEKVDLERQFEEYQRRKAAETAIVPAPSVVSEGQSPASEVPPKIDDEFGEEQFYLEPVE